MSTTRTHGSVASRSLAADAAEVCLTVTIVDGLVLARSVFEHGVNYRSAMIYARPRIVTDPPEKLVGLHLLSEHLAPGQWDYARQPSRKELAATRLLALSLAEASVKIRTGPPGDADSPDAGLELWAGELPLDTRWRQPCPTRRFRRAWPPRRTSLPGRGTWSIRGGSRRLPVAARSAYPLAVAEPAHIPTGTVTLLFTDIEGSTRLWEAEPEPMAQALRRHDEILRAAIEQAGGYVFKTVGDAFHAAFDTVQPAATAALAAQRTLGAEPWPTSRPIRVRMGLHTGVCEERDGDYFGPVVNRAARLEAVAHGGQVVVSGVTAELLSEAPADGIALRDLGLHRLKDLGRPEHVFQLEASFLESSFPPISSLDNPELANNLPSVLSPFVGRNRELAEVRDLVRRSRLVTLTGADGSGKTRLALQAAADLLDGAIDAVWFVELAPLTEPEQVGRAVAAVLGLPEEQSLTPAVTQALAGQDALIVLDNCEHLIDAAAKLCDQVIRHCPKVAILATSREPLGIDGERVYRVPSLSLPQPGADTADELGASDAVRLFAARAQVHDPAFSLDDSVAPVAASVCRRLDGIPLALELAAARLSSMSLQHVSERLDQRFRLLTGGSRNVMPRQQTLQAAVDWSFGLLRQTERETLIRLSVFVGGFELEAAEAICAAGGVDALEVMDLLGSLVDKSLVVADRLGDSVRYRLLDTIRQYSAEELLRACGDAEVLRIRSRHAEYYLGMAEAAEPALTGSSQGRWLRRLDAEWGNLRAAFAHLQADNRAEDVLRLGVALRRFAVSRGHAEVIGYLRTALAESAPEPLLAAAHLATGRLISLLLRKEPAELPAVQRHGELALSLARQLADRRLEAQALGLLALAAYLDHDRDRVHSLGESAVAIAREVGDPQLLGELLPYLVVDAFSEDSRRIHAEALGCFRHSGDTLYATNELHDLSGIDLVAGRFDDARDKLEQAIAAAEDLGDEVFLYSFRNDLAILLLIQGEYEKAAPLVRSCLLVARRTGARSDVSQVIFGAACLAMWRGDYLPAARLFGAADVDLRASLADGSIRWTEPERRLQDAQQGRLRELMGGESFDQGYRSGAELSRVQAVELALGRDMRERFAINSR
jgi:predicted ATPase/class 3 adenylate cyclase